MKTNRVIRDCFATSWLAMTVLVLTMTLGTVPFGDSPYVFGAEPALRADGASPKGTAEEATLPALIEEVKAQNPELKSAHAKWMSAKEKVPQERSLPDPMATYVYMGNDIQTRSGPQENKYMVSQKIPLFGKLSLKGVIAQKEAEALGQNYRLVERRLIADVSKAYYELFWVHKAVEITRLDISLLKHLEEVAQAKYAAGGGSQQDVLKAQVEISKAQERLLNFEQRRTALEAKLNALLNRPQETTLGKPAEPKLPELRYSIDEIYEITREYNQRLQAAGIMVERNKTKLSLSRQMYKPDITVGVEYISIGAGTTMRADDGEDAWMIPLSINLPIWKDRLDAGVRQARREVESSEEEYRNVKNSILAEVDDVYFRLKTSKEIIDLYRTAVVPQSSQSLDSAEAGYKGDTVDFLHLLDSERIWLSSNLTEWRAVADYGAQFAELERLAGKGLSGGGE